MNKTLSIIIVNYNTSEILKDCLANLENLYDPMEIIVVDVASPDDSVEMVKNNFPNVKLLTNTKNVGLAIGSNQGFKAATGDYILYLGSDAFPKKDTLKGLVDYMETNPTVGGATCKLVLRSGKLDMDAHRGFPTPWAALTHFSRLNRIFPKSQIFNQYFVGYENLEEPHEIDLCISHFLILRRAAIEGIGGWDEDYFVYGEDVDFCYRLKQVGWKLMYLPQWTAVHYKGVSVGTRKETADITKATKESKQKMLTKTTGAMAMFYDKHYSNKYPKVYTGFILLGIKLLGKARIMFSK